MENMQDYIGDGVYIEFDGHSFVLRANDHRDGYCTDKIYLEKSVMEALKRFVDRVKENGGGE